MYIHCTWLHWQHFCSNVCTCTVCVTTNRCTTNVITWHCSFYFLSNAIGSATELLHSSCMEVLNVILFILQGNPQVRWGSKASHNLTYTVMYTYILAFQPNIAPFSKLPHIYTWWNAIHFIRHVYMCGWVVLLYSTPTYHKRHLIPLYTLCYYTPADTRVVYIAECMIKFSVAHIPIFRGS